MIKLKDKTILYLSQQDILNLNIKMQEIIQTVEEGLKIKAEDDVDLPPKPSIFPRQNGFIQAMPAYVGGSIDKAGIKWVSGYEENPKKGLPYVNALMILNDAETGLPIAVMDATYITTVRTGAATAIAIKYLANGDNLTVGVIGLGTQGKSNLIATLHTLNKKIKEVLIYDISPDKMDEYINYIRQHTKDLSENIAFLKQKTHEDVIKNADILITAIPMMPNPPRFVKSGMLKENAVYIAIDYDSSLSGDALNEAKFFITDDINQYESTKQKGPYFSDFEIKPDTSLDKIVAGKVKPPDQGIKIAVLLGIASHDVATANLIYKKAIEKNIGTILPL